MAFTLFGKSGLASLLTTGKTGLAAALTVGAGAAIGAGTLVKNDAGEPLISTLLSSPAQLESPAVPGGADQTGQQASGSQESQQLAALPKDADGSETAAVVQDPPGTPRFDILRVEPDGSVVVAGSALPGSGVEILSAGKVVATGKAAASGDFAIVFDEPLPAGDHELVIRAMPESGEPVLSVETGIVSIPQSDGKGGEVLAMISRDGAASRILQGPGSETAAQEVAEVASAEEKPADEPAQVAATEEPASEPETQVKEPEPVKPLAPVLVQAVDVEKDRLFVAGKGEPGTTVRIYLDGDFKGETAVAPQGTFLFELAQGLEPGRHQLRADMLGQDGAAVASRAQVAVDHQPEPPQQVAEAAPKQVEVAATEPEPAEPQAAAVETPEPAKAPEPAQAVAAEKPVAETVEQQEPGTAQNEETPEPVQTAAAEPAEEAVITTGRSVIIRRGDNLWRISRRMLGEGSRYTLIFEANTNQIRNPNLIFPGQVFDVPEDEGSADAGQSGSG
ncbi:MAG: Ig-like domain-containing protein [Nitratireductor sp.]